MAAPSTILDSRGRPARLSAPQRNGKSKAINLLYNHPYTVYHAGDFRYRPFITSDTDKTLTGASRMQYVNWSRQIFSQILIMDFAMELICDWAVGSHYEMIYRGADAKFGNALEEWLNNVWFNNCNILGTQAFNFRNTLKQIIREICRDGDLLQVYNLDSNGFPKLQYIRTHRVMERNGIKEIPKGQFEGAPVSDGCIKDKATGAVIGYYVQDRDNQNDDYMVSVTDSCLIFQSKWFDLPRGCCPLMPAILDAFTTQECDDAIDRRCKLETTLGVQRHTPTGEGSPAEMIQWPTDQDQGLGLLPPIVSPPLAPPMIQPIIGGLQYLEMGAEEIRSLISNTPHDELSGHLRVKETRCMAALGVPHQLLFSPTDISRAPARGISGIFNKTLEKTQNLLETFIRPAIVWAVSSAIEKGFLDASTKEKWWNFIDFTRPEQFTLDAYNEAKQQMEAYKLGLTTRDNITTTQYGRRGTNVLKSRTQEVVELWSAAIEAKQTLDKKYPDNGLTVIDMHNDLELRTSNPLPETVSAAPENKNEPPIGEDMNNA